jgi:hypothetical protein
MEQEPSDAGARRWIHEHDDRWSFILPYVMLSVALSVAISLFWLGMLILVHGALEWVRLRQEPSGRRLLLCLARTQLDWALLMAAICMEVYLETAAGLAGAGQFARGLGRILARVPGWQYTLRAVMLSSDDALQLIRLKKSTTGEDATVPRLERTATVIFLLAADLLILAPVVLPIDAGDVPGIVRNAFHPWP